MAVIPTDCVPDEVNGFHRLYKAHVASNLHRQGYGSPRDTKTIVNNESFEIIMFNAGVDGVTRLPILILAGFGTNQVGEDCAGRWIGIDGVLSKVRRLELQGASLCVCDVNHGACHQRLGDLSQWHRENWGMAVRCAVTKHASSSLTGSSRSRTGRVSRAHWASAGRSPLGLCRVCPLGPHAATWSCHQASSIIASKPGRVDVFVRDRAK